MLFDTLKHVKMMQKVGFSDDQSEAMIRVWSNVVRDQFVTKQDLKQALLEERLITNKQFEEIKLEISDLRADINSVRGEINNVRGEINNVRGGLNNLENRITVKLGSIMVGVITVSKILEKFF